MNTSKRGEVATLVVAGTMVVLAFTMMLTSLFSGTKKSTNSRASETYVDCKDRVVAAGAGWYWKADCGKACTDVTNHSDCPANPEDPDPPTSHWCYLFKEGARCMQRVKEPQSGGQTSSSPETPPNGNPGGTCFSLSTDVYADKDGDGYKFNTHVRVYSPEGGGDGHIQLFVNGNSKGWNQPWNKGVSNPFDIEPQYTDTPRLTSGSVSMNYRIKIDECNQNGNEHDITCQYGVANGKPWIKGEGCNCKTGNCVAPPSGNQSSAAASTSSSNGGTEYCPDGGVKQGNSCDYGRYDAGMNDSQNQCLIDSGHSTGDESNNTCWSWNSGCYKTAYGKNSQNADGSWGACHYANANVCRRGDFQGGCAGVCNNECCTGGQRQMSGEEYDSRNKPGSGGNCFTTGNPGGTSSSSKAGGTQTSSRSKSSSSKSSSSKSSSSKSSSSVGATTSSASSSSASGCPWMMAPSGRSCTFRFSGTCDTAESGYNTRIYCPNSTIESPWCCKPQGVAQSSSSAAPVGCVPIASGCLDNNTCYTETRGYFPRCSGGKYCCLTDGQPSSTSSSSSSSSSTAPVGTIDYEKRGTVKLVINILNKGSRDMTKEVSKFRAFIPGLAYGKLVGDTIEFVQGDILRYYTQGNGTWLPEKMDLIARYEGTVDAGNGFKEIANMTGITFRGDEFTKTITVNFDYSFMTKNVHLYIDNHTNCKLLEVKKGAVYKLNNTNISNVPGSDLPIGQNDHWEYTYTFEYFEEALRTVSVRNMKCTTDGWGITFLPEVTVPINNDGIFYLNIE